MREMESPPKRTIFKKKYNPALLIICFFVLFLIAGILVYKDFGIPWDEAAHIDIGTKYYRYIFKNDPQLLSDMIRYYGAIIELPLLWLSSRFSIPRHLLLFLLFFVGVIVFYIAGKRLFSSQGWGFLGALLLILSPRILGDSFYNSKDIPFMVFSIVGVSTLLLLSNRIQSFRDWKPASLLIGLHSLSSAALIATRIVGIFIIPITILVIIVKLMQPSVSWKKMVAIVGGYLILMAGLTILLWPILWHNHWRSLSLLSNK